jgi:hypothetical protein
MSECETVKKAVRKQMQEIYNPKAVKRQEISDAPTASCTEVHKYKFFPDPQKSEYPKDRLLGTAHIIFFI